MDDKRFALLIDADNISAKYISGILDEITKYGMATYKRIYGDWTSPQAGKWREELLSNSIVPIQQFSNTTGKNATDSALIIDAMDILYGGQVEGFCIVSSDSDFTRLASRLRESGMDVLGMGEEKTPQSFRSACTKFINLENLLESGEVSEGTELTQSAIEKVIINIVTENQNKGKDTGLGEIGSRLGNKYPDFDVRNFGYSYLSKFIEEMPRLAVNKAGKALTVSLSNAEDDKDQVIAFIKNTVSGTRAKKIGLNQLSNLVHQKFQGFELKEYGYSQFYKLVQSIDGIEVTEDKNNRKQARAVK